LRQPPRKRIELAHREIRAFHRLERDVDTRVRDDEPLRRDTKPKPCQPRRQSRKPRVFPVLIVRCRRWSSSVQRTVRLIDETENDDADEEEEQKDGDPWVVVKGTSS